jgi:hypothetical protein
MDEYNTLPTNDEIDMYWDIMDKIVDEEEMFWEREKTDGNYYLGIVKVDRHYNDILMSNSISVPTFYKYDINTLTDYLRLHSPFRYNVYPRVHIMQLHIDNGVYKAVIKTFWLRIIQRTWKRIYKEKMRVIVARGHPNAQHHFAVNGKYHAGVHWLPGLSGMLVGSE